MITKTVEELRSEMTTEILRYLPNLDLTEGTPERDIFIEAPISGQLITLWNKLIYAAKLHSPVIYYNDLDLSDIQNYCLNYNVTRRAATYSTGAVTFFTYAEPATDISILSGTKVSTSTTPEVEFVTTSAVTLPYLTRNSYYNATNSRWEIVANIQAVNPGAEYRAGSSSITKMGTSVSGISGCINTSVVSGGTAEETTEAMLRRVVDKFQGRGLGTTVGVKSFVENYATAVSVVESTDPYMLRDGGVGGAVDIYVIGSTSTTVTDTISISSTGLTSPLTVSYTSTGIRTAYQPITSISSVVVNSTVLSSTYYTLTKDTGLLARSTDSFDRVTLTSAGLAAVGPFEAGDTIYITYIYNSLLATIDSELVSQLNHYMNRDYLVREMIPVTIDVYMQIKESTGQDFNAQKASWELAISDQIASVKTEGSVELADIVGVIKSKSTVDNVDLTTVALTNTGGGTKTTYGDILLGKTQYPITGTITLIQWTS